MFVRCDADIKSAGFQIRKDQNQVPENKMQQKKIALPQMKCGLQKHNPEVVKTTPAFLLFLISGYLIQLIKHLRVQTHNNKKKAPPQKNS